MNNYNSLYRLKKKFNNNNKYRCNQTSYDLLNSSRKDHWKYHKLYTLSKTKEQTPKINKLKVNLKYKKKLEFLKKIFHKPPALGEGGDPSSNYWPKVTKPKLPFTTRKKMSSEMAKMRIMSLKPNPKFHDFNTIKWLRNKYSDSLLEKSINTLLPDNGRPVVPDDESEEEKKHRELMEFLDSIKPIIAREKNVNINPKYFFNTKTFEKILKLKEIFLEFDEDGSRKMEIDEMLTMFNQNHICADINELVKLFFKNKEFKEKDIMKLYLDFYQFMQFALNKDEDFRNFMREIKEKYNNNKDIEKSTYLPMNFNLVLDYFIIKGKERSSVEVIENSINLMDQILNNKISKKSKKLDLLGSERSIKDYDDIPIKKISSKLPSTKQLNPRKSINLSIDSSDDSDKAEYKENLEKINFMEPLDEFDKLFKAHRINVNKKISQLNLINKSYEKNLNKKLYTVNNTISTDKSTNIAKTPNIKRIINKKRNFLFDSEEDRTRIDSKNEEESKDNSTLINIVNNLLNKRLIQKINTGNYEKLHDIKIALQTTNNQIDLIKKLNKKKEMKIFDINNIKTINNFSKDNVEYSNESFFRKKNKYNFNNLSKKLNPFFLYTSHINKNNEKTNRFPYSLKNNKFISKENNDNVRILNNTVNHSSNTNNSFNIKQKFNKINSLDKSKKNRISKFDYVPPELLLSPEK